MGGSLKIARLFGIPVYLHWTFALIFVYLFVIGRWRGWGDAEIFEAFLLSISLFACVVLHELGHALTARRFGIQTRDIILSPIGGIARLNRLPEAPMQEVLVALAGPMVNIGIVLVISPGLLMHSWSQWRDYVLSMDPDQSNYIINEVGPAGQFLASLILLNGMLALFNLLPAFPMDGGRVLRALLSLKLGRLKATRLATYIGQSMAILLFVYGLSSESGSYTLIFIGIFVFVMAAMEFYMVRMDDALASYSVSDIMRTDFTRAYVSDSLERTLRLAGPRQEQSFLVFDEWQNLRGTVTQRELRRALETAPNQGCSILLGHINPRYTPLFPGDSLQKVLHLIQDKDEMAFPVVDRQRVIGIVDFYMVQRLMTKQREPLRQRLERLPISLKKRLPEVKNG